MAKTWRNKGSVLEIKGFEELYEKFEKAGKNAANEGRKCFEICAENLEDELNAKAESAGLPQHLIEQITTKITERPNEGYWRFEVGWRKTKPKEPLPDTYKVMFYNYGTPSGNRHTKKGANRGQEPAHPLGSHGFIKKAKLAAGNKNKKVIKQKYDEILKELK